MGWQDLLDNRYLSLPWKGGRQVHSHDRTWTILGRLPSEHGWHSFSVGGAKSCAYLHPSQKDWSYFTALPIQKGYLVGNRFIPDNARVDPDPTKLCEQTREVFCLDGAFERLQRVSVGQDRVGDLIFKQVEFPIGPEVDVIQAYQDQRETLAGIKGVTPALDLAFRWLTIQREDEKERAAKRAEAERLQQLMQQTGSAVGRRALARQDFRAAAESALRVSGASLLDVLPTHRKNEMRVQYLFQERRLECVVHAETLQIIDAGVCLNGDGVRGDTFFTLESLPGVVAEAIRRGVLVVFRHVGRDDD